MKKILLIVSALVLGLASCTQKELGPVTPDGENVTVSFTTSIQGADDAATRAYSDGYTAKILKYFVYDETDEQSPVYLDQLSGIAAFDEGQLTQTISLELVTGKYYSIVFWAEAEFGEGETNPYSYDTGTKEITVAYGGAAQNEKRDAFYAYKGRFKVGGALSEPITLKRPFAQINIGTNDYDAADKSGVTPVESGMKVKGVSESINLATGVVGEPLEREVVFEAATIKKDETFPVEGYTYLGMNYVLVGEAKSLVDVTLNYGIDDVVFTQVPVQRNYRTNIYGSILTDPNGFEVTIEPGYGEPDNEINLVPSVSIKGIRGMENLTFATLAEAYDKGKELLLAAGDDLGQSTTGFDVYTDGGNITWIIAGQHELDTTGRSYFFSFGRKAGRYASDKHIGIITVQGANSNNEYDGIKVIGTGFTAPYQWWDGDPTPSSMAFKDLTLTSTSNQLGVGQAYAKQLDVTVENCIIKAFWYAYFNAIQNLTFKNNVFDGTGIAHNYALHVQGHASQPTTLNFEGNTVSGYNRGINIDQKTCEAVVKNNTITSGPGYSAMQLSMLANATIEGNTIYNNGNVLTFHKVFATNALTGNVVFSNNTVKEIEGVQGYLVYDDITASGSTYGEGGAQINLTFEDNTIPANTIIDKGIKGTDIHPVANYLLEQLGYSAGGYFGELLPPAPKIEGNVMIVNTANAQYTLDGAYGSLDGKTIRFSAGTYDRLIFGRPTKFAGSNTVYRHGSYDNETMTFDDFYAYKNQPGWTEGCYYERAVENLTFTAEAGAVLTGMTYLGGAHIYGAVKDYVLERSYEAGSAYYHTLYARNIVYDGIDFQFDNADSEPCLQIATSQIRTEIDGIVVKNCSFTGIGEINSKAAIRFYWELPANKEGNEDKAVKNLTVENSTFDNLFQGIYTQNACGVTVKNCTIKNTKHNAIAIQGGKEGWLFNHGAVVITGNTFENIGDRIIRFGYVGNGTAITICGNTATNSGDIRNEIMKAQILEDGVTYDIHDNNWGEGKFAYNDELKDRQ